MTAHSTETITEAVRMYLAGSRIDDIVATTGLSAGALYYYLDGGAEKRVSAPRRRFVARGKAGSADLRPQNPLVARLWRAAARATREIERRLVAPQDAVARRQDLLMLAQMVRTLREITALDTLARTGEATREASKARAFDAKQRLWDADMSLMATQIEIAQDQQQRGPKR